MTEDEAKTKWCPYARGLVEVEGPTGFTVTSANRRGMSSRGPTFGLMEGSDLPKSSLCIGSACMAWRWHVPPNVIDAALYAGNPNRDGHCGLAGQP